MPNMPCADPGVATLCRGQTGLLKHYRQNLVVRVATSSTAEIPELPQRPQVLSATGRSIPRSRVATCTRG